MEQSDRILAAGLMLAALGSALAQFVLIGLAGLFLFAASLLPFGAVIFSTPTSRSLASTFALPLALSGLGLLLAACLLTGSQAFASHLHSLRPGMTGPDPLGGLRILGLACPGAAALAWALRLRQGWSLVRTLFWAGLFLAACPLTLLLFALLAPFLPLSA